MELNILISGKTEEHSTSSEQFKEKIIPEDINTVDLFQL
jgi:hypothetical protein